MIFTFNKGGIHPRQSKVTAGEPIVTLDAPRKVVLPLSQHIGAPSVAVVKTGDRVERWQLVAKSNGVVSASLHTPIAGVVKSVGAVMTWSGKMTEAIVVEATEDAPNKEVPIVRDDETVAALSASDIREIIAEAGIVGLGGATFPTAVKLTPPRDANIDTLVVNGAECEPYLTNDDALMRESARQIVDGARFAMRACGAKRCIIGVEMNKPEAIAALENAVLESVEVARLATKYPQGGEKQLIKAVTGREVQSGALPSSVGVAVANVATCFAIHEAVRYGKPLVERVVTVSGNEISGGGNFRVCIGMSLVELVEAAGGVPEDTGKLIIGGPMMGRTAVTLDAPIEKGNSGVVMLSEEMSRRRCEEVCVRCGRCIEACPMGLEPYLISALARQGELDRAKEESILDCIECGSCSYVCPSSRPLVDYIRYGKNGLRIKAQKKK